ncbi:hypothetical protein R6Z07F_008199 [Ovis aries]
MLGKDGLKCFLSSSPYSGTTVQFRDRTTLCFHLCASFGRDGGAPGPSPWWKGFGGICKAVCGGVTQDGSERLLFGKGTKLTVSPQIKDPNPTVYQLRSPESSNTSVCLFTDFDSNQINLTQIGGYEWNMVHKTDSTVLNMEILGSKSNGIVTWGNTSDSGCTNTFNENIEFVDNFGIPCDAKLVEKSFETDVNLNSQNLSVTVFRILLLKVVGFNLLMTLRLWSS